MQAYTITVSLDTDAYRSLEAAALAATVPIEEYCSTLLDDHARHVSSGNEQPKRATGRARATR